MKHVESFIIGVCGAFLALILQIILVPEHAFYAIASSEPEHPTLLVIAWVVAAAATEELVRLGFIARYALMRGVPHDWWVHGLLFGAGFGLTEIALGITNLTSATLPYACAALLLHIVLSIFVTRALPYFAFFRYSLTFLFLLLLHSLYNLAVLFVFPLVHTWLS